MSSQVGVEEGKANFLKKRLVRTIIIGVIIILVLVGIIVGLRNTVFSSSKTTKIGFEDIGELATQSAYCTEVNVTKAARELFGVQIPFTESKYIYSYDVEIKAGFDFGEVEWILKDHCIEVKLPKAKVLNCEVDQESFKLYLEDESVFRQITMTENNEAMIELKQKAEKEAVANGLLDHARSNAETILEGFFSDAYDLNEYEIKFIDK